MYLLSQPRDGTQVSLTAVILYYLSHQESRWILEWVAYPFFRGSSWPRNWTGVPCIAGRFFTSWATRKVPMENVCLTNHQTENSALEITNIDLSFIWVHVKILFNNFCRIFYTSYILCISRLPQIYFSKYKNKGHCYYWWYVIIIIFNWQGHYYFLFWNIVSCFIKYSSSK